MIFSGIELILLTSVICVLGTLMHFVYKWTGEKLLLGYIFPVDECVWEHMKMVFYPMLLAGIYAAVRFNNFFRICSFAYAGIIAMPIMIGLFYIYWPFTHHSVLTFDCCLYFGVLVFAILVGNKLNAYEQIMNSWPICIILALVVFFFIVRWTYNKPKKLNFLFHETDHGHV